MLNVNPAVTLVAAVPHGLLSATLSVLSTYMINSHTLDNETFIYEQKRWLLLQ